MRHTRKARLERLETARSEASCDDDWQRIHLYAEAMFGTAVEAGLTAAGIAPDTAGILQHARAAAEQLAALVQRRQEAAARPRGIPADPLLDDPIAANILRLAERYRARAEDGREIDFAQAPLIDLLAWCVAQGHIEMQLEGECLLFFRCINSERELVAQL